MNAHSNHEQIIKSNEQDEKAPYEQPEVTDMGKVDQLTALLTHGTPDLLSHGNIL